VLPSFRNVRQLGNCSKNSLEGCLAQTTHLPMARACGRVDGERGKENKVCRWDSRVEKSI
jgi:hypothetical protein